MAESEPTPETPKSRGGYGICEDLLISDYDPSEEGEEGDEEEEEDELDSKYSKFHHLEEKASGSGVSTSGTNSTVPRSGQTTCVGASTSYMIPDDELPISHERSTKDIDRKSVV